MTELEVGKIILALGVLLGGANFIGYVFERLRQPRLAGEILSGILLGPFVFGLLFPGLFDSIFGSSSDPANKVTAVLGFVYWFGLLLLMFISGSEVRHVLAVENRKAMAWILGLGVSLPFLIIFAAWGTLSVLPLDAIMGTVRQEIPALLVLAVAVSVTSIPVISRIFHELKILHTKFASLILGIALIEDIILWAVLAVATAIAAKSVTSDAGLAFGIASHIAITMAYIAAAFFLAPKLLKRIHTSRWNIFARSHVVGYSILVLFTYAITAALLNVNLVFAAFLAGFGMVGGMGGMERERFSKTFQFIERFSGSTFIPIYFALVGYRLVFGQGFSLTMLAIFFAASSILTLVARGYGAQRAGFKGLDIANIAIVSNARGGPGIVLASVAYDAGIINATFYTTLVLTAILTSQAAGFWLRYVLGKGSPLLSSSPEETWVIEPKRPVV